MASYVVHNQLAMWVEQESSDVMLDISYQWCCIQVYSDWAEGPVGTRWACWMLNNNGLASKHYR
jgi:hypothetical protein